MASQNVSKVILFHNPPLCLMCAVPDPDTYSDERCNQRARKTPSCFVLPKNGHLQSDMWSLDLHHVSGVPTQASRGEMNETIMTASSWSHRWHLPHSFGLWLAGFTLCLPKEIILKSMLIRWLIKELAASKLHYPWACLRVHPWLWIDSPFHSQANNPSTLCGFIFFIYVYN